MVDVVRLGVYAVGLGLLASKTDYAALSDPHAWRLVGAASAAAFAGSFAGTRLVKKVTIRGLQRMVGLMLLVLAVAMGVGLI